MSSSATSARRRKCRAASSTRNRRCICPISRMSIPRRATPRASGSRFWATAARSASPRSRVRSSMSDEDKKKAKKAAPEGAKDGAKAGGEKKAKDGGKKAAAAPAVVHEEVRDPNYVPRFKKRYNDVVRPALMKEFGYKNAMQVPKIEKIVLNIGAGEAASDQKKIQSALNDLTAIAGQKAVLTRAKKAIATFKIRNGLPIGV